MPRATKLVDGLLRLNQTLGVPRLSECQGVTRDRFDAQVARMAQDAFASGSPGNNPVVPTARADCRPLPRDLVTAQASRRSRMFKAVLLSKRGDAFAASLADLDDQQLPQGDVLLRVEYSTLNYKDALAITNRAPVVRPCRWWPASTAPARWRRATQPGTGGRADRAVLNGWGVGESHWGCLAQRARLRPTGSCACRRASTRRRRWPSARPATRPCCA